MAAPARHIRVRPEIRPVLPRHVRLKYDELRERWLLLAPERILVPDDVAVEVLRMCNGTASVADLVAALAAKYDAPETEIMQDVQAMLQGLADKGFLSEMKEATHERNQS